MVDWGIYWGIKPESGMMEMPNNHGVVVGFHDG